MFVDAGSAITVDIVQDGSYKGGFILLGLKAMIKAYGSISPALDVTLNKDISLSELPTTTKEQISYGIIASIKSLIDQQREGRPLYFTGGDGRFLSSFFEDVIYDEMLVFNGMKQAIQ
jgi:type III pantothenate kinase